MESIQDLFSRMRTILPTGRVLSERAGVLQFFYEQGFKHKDGTEFTKKELGIRCAHLKIDQLYYIQSVLKDKKHRGENAGKYFMGATKTTRV